MRSKFWPQTTFLPLAKETLDSSAEIWLSGRFHTFPSEKYVLRLPCFQSGSRPAVGSSATLEEHSLAEGEQVRQNPVQEGRVQQGHIPGHTGAARHLGRWERNGSDCPGSRETLQVRDQAEGVRR